MSADNVTPIRSAGGPPRMPSRPPTRQRRPKINGLLLSESDEFDGYSTLDVVNGLHGVCLALDQLPGSEDSIIQYGELGMAAKILSAILANRVEIG
jgi:hypothetical protein